jgi:hypothetical protein
MTGVRTFLVTSATVSLVAGGLLLGGSTAAVAADDLTDAPETVATESAAPEDASTGPDDSDADSSADTAGTADDDAPGGTTSDVPRSLRAAYGGLSVTPAGPYAGGETVTVKGTGFEANEQVVLSICLGDQKLAGPQDCASLNGPSSAVGAANGNGVASLQIKVIKGDLGAQSKPGHVCGNGAGESCVFSLTNFGGDGPAAVRVKYKTADTAADDDDSGSTGGDTKKNRSGAASDDDAADDTTSGTGADAGSDDGTGSATGGAEIAATGAGPATTSAALGATLLALGALLSVAERRWTPRTTRG